ncbi:DUF6382 domain-containing protein [Cohnella caldifontis]|uniref:DUF6382 domain-containing protein n=1 Tax=Cohnella caldifontis TaxID=3027471 RepID=UPI0023EB1571|nr:DUF6382 domain-containing protein [Cohnella sp. YIM B05605]
MDRLKVRFEQKRGHWLIVEGEPDLSREDCDPFRLRMLQSCEVPGLLKPEAEEIDGKLTLRYSIAGARMLSQAMRAEKWSIEDLMTSLCRLAEVMEDCRLYVLEESQIVLDDDRIFVGDGWSDLRLLYLPFRDGLTLPVSSIRDLIVRWIMHVSEPDGPTIQRLLRLSASPGFKAADLRTFARQALSEKIGTGAKSRFAAPEGLGENRPFRDDAVSSAGPIGAKPDGSAKTPMSANPQPPLANNGWRWFQPPSSEAQALSGLLGEDPMDDVSEEVGEKEIPEQTDRTRIKIWLVCGAVGAVALSWRWGYAAIPGRGGIWLSAALAIVIAAGALAIWFAIHRKRGAGGAGGARARSMEPPGRDDRRRTGEGGKPADVESAGWQEAKARSWREPAYPISISEDAANREPENGSRIQVIAEDRTQLLAGEHGTSASAVYCLQWESRADRPVLPLNVPSFVIGRSREASAHVDETAGVSRAHLELLRSGEGWTAKDLGSRNGTKLNGQPMNPYETYPLQSEDCLELAGSRYRFKQLSGSDTSF